MVTVELLDPAVPETVIHNPVYPSRVLLLRKPLNVRLVLSPTEVLLEAACNTTGTLRPEGEGQHSGQHRELEAEPGQEPRPASLLRPFQKLPGRGTLPPACRAGVWVSNQGFLSCPADWPGLGGLAAKRQPASPLRGPPTVLTGLYAAAKAA